MSKPSSVKPVSFSWEKGNPEIYDIAGPRVTYRAGGSVEYRPVIGSLALQPNTGKYFYEIRTNLENMRLGVCTADADVNAEMGKAPNIYSINLQTGACEVNGTELKKLWRLVVPVSGAVFGFIYDTDAGTMQLYMNTEFHGTPFNAAFGLKGKTVFPCVGLAGVEVNNRDIGVGKKYCLVTANPQQYRTFVL